MLIGESIKRFVFMTLKISVTCPYIVLVSLSELIEEIYGHLKVLASWKEQLNIFRNMVSKQSFRNMASKQSFKYFPLYFLSLYRDMNLPLKTLLGALYFWSTIDHINTQLH